MLAPDGRCKTLDAAAEGYVRAEAVGAAWVRCLRSVAGLTLGPAKPVRIQHLLCGDTVIRRCAKNASTCSVLHKAHDVMIRYSCVDEQEGVWRINSC